MVANMPLNMPLKVRDKERDRDLEVAKPREKTRRHRSSKSSRKPSNQDEDKSSIPSKRRSANASPSNERRASMPAPDDEKKPSSSSLPGSASASKTSLPYPSFSKAHSKEAVGSRDNLPAQRLSYYTPDPTDLEKSNDAKGVGAMAKPSRGELPSPPLTAVDPPPKDEPVKVERVKVERKRSDLQKHADDLKRRLVRGSSSSVATRETRSPKHTKSKVNERDRRKEDGKSTGSPIASKPSTPSKLKPRAATAEDSKSSSAGKRRSLSPIPSSLADTPTKATSSLDSDATSVAPNQPSVQKPNLPQNDDQNTNSPPQTPTNADPQYDSSRRQTPAFSIAGSVVDDEYFEGAPMPPPPPPPPSVPFQIPKVDYLMQNGGLTQAVPKQLIATNHSGRPPPDPARPTPFQPAEQFFSPLSNLLDDYTKVMGKSGSIAVATGYRSVARRLLDRLETVFARDISSEICNCTMCETSRSEAGDIEEERGVSWGEILEYVCGRQELPQWPALAFDAEHVGLGISAESQVPMQKLDIDVPDEFRDYYFRQSKKTKQSVDKWLQNQPEANSPPSDVDDETLSFAMLTRLAPERRPIFSSLLGVPSRPNSQGLSPSPEQAPDLLQKTGLAVQRLYRLQNSPRDPESAIYLLNNSKLHNVLATLAAVSDGEWEILVSGRFDGFLRSGANESHPDPTTTPFTPPSRNNLQSSTPNIPRHLSMSAPLPGSRGVAPYSTSPATVGAPVALDEETEIAALAEIERDIFLSMEALEDAFEALHAKAETVRHALRERGAGLSMASQARRGTMNGNNLDARLGTPAEGNNWESETDDGIDDAMSELVPDDSASNISRTSRHKGGKRRRERRTPAPVEEEDEDEE